MANSINPSDLGAAITEQLTLYHSDVIEKINAAGEKAVKALVQTTKQTAPKRSGDYRKAITSETRENPTTGDKEFIWGARSPHHRLTHLLVNGHMKQNGGRVPGDPFLQNALDQVLPEYEKDVKEAIEG